MKLFGYTIIIEVSGASHLLLKSTCACVVNNNIYICAFIRFGFPGGPALRANVHNMIQLEIASHHAYRSTGDVPT